MTKIKLMRIALIALGVLLLSGTVFVVYKSVSASKNNVISVDIKDEGETSVFFEDLCMIPGETSEYTVTLGNKGAKNYDVSVSFRENGEKKNSLKNYAFVRIEVDGRIVCDERLSTLLEGEDIVLSVSLSGEDTEDVKITYYLPRETGNEAQGTEVSFELLITASNE